MCSQRIDEAYSRLFINEKKKPQDRFIQVLDELSITGETKEFFTNTFSENLNDWFFSIDDAEKALSLSQSYPLLKDKVAIFLKESYPYKTFPRDFDLYYKGHEIPTEKKNRIEFIIELSKPFYSDSAYELYNSEFGKIFSLKFPLLSDIIYGKGYCSSSKCFDDQTLNNLAPHARTKFLWSIFNELCNYQIIINPNHYSTHNNKNHQHLIDHINSENNKTSNESSNLKNAFYFLKAWIINDAKNNRPFESLTSITKEITSYFYSFPSCTDENDLNILSDWRRALQLELQWLVLKNYDLSKVDEQVSESWSSEAENHYLMLRNEIETEEHSLFIKQRVTKFKSLIKDLPSTNIKYWVKNNIKNDLEKDRSTYNLTQSKWCQEGTYEIWKNEFQLQLDQLSIPDQIKILSISAPYWEQPDSDNALSFHEKHATWWNSLYLNIPNHENFQKSFLPKWTIAGINNNKAVTSELLPYVDQSIGILRGDIFGENSPTDNQKATQELAVLLDWLEDKKPDKALRHRLILFRSSQAPLGDEGLNYRTKADDCLWYQPLKDIKPSSFDSTKTWDESLTEFYQSLAQQISEFCLSRLQLRKKEKAVNGEYSSSQVVEISPNWRQGYLKAITEIGLDLKGKVHKTAYFIKQADEDENVRAIAAETYKAVRRKSATTPSAADLKRSIIAAEWWLLHCQRQELGLDINFDEALKTRRRLLRNQ
jgi:hypothetical protein